MYKIDQRESKILNILKAFLIVMVVYAHSNLDGVNFSDNSLSYSIPAWLQWIKFGFSKVVAYCTITGYFTISSMLLYKKDFDWKANVKSKVRKLLLPYFIFNTIWICIYLVARRIEATSVFFASAETNVYAWGIVEWLDAYLGFRTGVPVVYHLWFLRDLFVMNVLAKVLKRIIDRFPRLSFTVILAIWVLGIDTHFFLLSTDALCFFAFGYFIVKYDIKISRICAISGKWLYPVYVLGVVCACFFQSINASLPYAICHGTTTLLGLAVWTKIASMFVNFTNTRILQSLIQYNFGIYLFHEYALRTTMKVSSRLLPTTVPVQLLQILLVPGVIITGCCILCYLMHRFIPKVYAFVTGGR